MVQLPPVPNLNPDDDGKPEAAPTPAPAPAPAPAEPAVTAPVNPVELPPPGVEEAEDGVPKPVPAPGDPPAVTAGEAGVVQDSVEEVLQQAADQSLRLSHLEDILGALNQTLGDIQDEMHAGFAEIRAVTEGAAEPATRPTEATFKSSLTERLDFVEEQAIKSGKLQSTLMMIAVVQLVLVVAVLLAVFLVGGSSSPEPSGPTPTYLSTETPAPAADKPEPPVLEPTRIKSKRKRSRKR